MTRASVVRRFLLLAAWTLGAASCGDFVGDDASEFADANMDATADAPAAVDTDVHVPDALVDAQANETPDNAVDAPGTDAGAPDAAPDASPDADVLATDAGDAGDDAVDADAAQPDAAADTVDVPDGADTGVDQLDAAPDVDDDDAFDPNCPYSPKSICLHWGVCKTGNVKVDCSSGEPLCDYSAVAGYEIVEKSCDGLDNDCNNLVDDALKVPLASKTEGVCQGQVKACGGLSGWQDPNFLLVPQYQPVETACDGLDNDCDGAIDLFATEKKLSTFSGVCADANYICGGASGWQMPGLSTLPFWEAVETMCDGLDNDCDGLTDEDMDTPNFLGSGVKVNNQGVCNGALIRCLQGVWSPPDYSLQPGFEAIETSCDGLDNDCNGLVDDLVPGLASKQAGVCAGQTLVCSGKIGWQDPDWLLLPGYLTGYEWACDGLDNDCNGLTDEDAACPIWQVGGRGHGQVALSPDGQHLAWTTTAGAQVLDWQTRTVQRNWFGHKFAVAAVGFSPDGSQVVTGGQQDVLQVWPLAASPTPSVALQPLLNVSGMGTTFAAVAFSPNGGQVAVGDATGTVRIYAMWSGQQVAALIGHKSQVAAIAWLPDAAGQNGVLLSGDDGGAVWRWQPVKKTGEQMALLQGATRAIAAMPGTTHVLLVAENQAIVVDSENGTPLVQLHGGSVTWTGGALRTDAGGEALLLTSVGAVQRYSLPQPTGLLLDVTPTTTVAPPVEVANDAAMSLSAQNGHVAVGFAANGPWQLDVTTGAWLPATTRHLGAVQDAALSGSLLVSGGDDSLLRFWRAEDGASLLNLTGHTGPVLTVQPLTQLPLALPKSDLPTLLASGFALASGSEDYTVRLWSLTPTAGGVAVLTPKTFGLGGPWPTDLALTADVAGFWAAGGPTLGKYASDVAKLGQKLNAYPTKLGNVIERVVPSPDGQWLALGMSGDGPAFNIHYRIVNAKTFAVLHEWSGMPAPVHALAWSADGARIALAGPQGVIQVAQVQSGAVEQQLFGHTAPVTSLAWAPVGRLLSTAKDGTARVWSAVAGQAILPWATFARHCATPCSDASGTKVEVLGGLWQDAQGTRIITFGDDGSLFSWKGPTGP